MNLPPGAKLGPYEILSKLGEGGMGDVYKARDTRLERFVAIKIVRTDFSERFQREAKSISALNHPNICTLHDVGEQDGTAYLVMEFVDGAHIAGPLPVQNVIKYGILICEALDAAHRAGIVHRDLKPANVLATKSGIKLLDFGLAKLQAKAGDALGDAATVAALTGAHTIVGTPQYMAPEQIEGREADVRSDIFALGCVLYELVTGTRAFGGKTASSVMAAVLATEPRRLSEVVPLTPPPLEWIVSKCLEKDPDARWQSARDVALQLKWLADHPADLAKAPGRTSSSLRALVTGLAIGAVLTAAGAAAWMTWRGGAPVAAQPPTSLSVTLPPGLSLLSPGVNPSIALSPDGQMMALGLRSKEGIAIYLRRFDSFDVVKVTGTDGGSGPFFSPRGDWIGFHSDFQIKKVPTTGGASVAVADVASLRGAVWLDDDTIVYSPGATGGLMRVPSGGGTPVTVTTLNAAQQEKTHRKLVALPGGKAVVFSVGSNEIGTYDDARIVAMELGSGRIIELVKGGYGPAFSPSGHLLYVSHESLFAVRLDTTNLKLIGSPVQVVDDIASLPHYGVGQFAVSSAGSLAYASGGDRSDKIDLHWIDRKGHTEPIALEPRTYCCPAFSQDGRKLSLQVSGANNALFSYDLQSRQITRVTLKFDADGSTWTPDGDLTYWSGMDVRTIASDRSGREEVLIPAAMVAGRILRPMGWSKDGQKLTLDVTGPGKRPDVLVYLKSEKKFISIAETRFDEFAGPISPDGRWVAYESNESGPFEIYVRASDGTGAKYQVTSEGGFAPSWTKEGRELLYGTPKGIFAASFTATAAPVFGNRELLFALDTPKLADITQVLVLPSGERFVALNRRPSTPITEIKVVANWADRLAGAAK